MSDAELRELARSGDDRAKLEREWIRRGLGWHGEELWTGDVQDTGPLYMRFAVDPEKRGVYRWEVRDPGARTVVVALELVYVPVGEIECKACHKGTTSRVGGGYTSCRDCDGSGKLEIAPFYVGRFPVTHREWRAYGLKSLDRLPSELSATRVSDVPDFDHYPISNVSLEDARQFCEWAGLRLPTEQEWRWAALGKGRIASGVPKFPWGDEPPSPERCVWAGHPVHGRRMRRVDPDVVGGGGPLEGAVDDLPFPDFERLTRDVLADGGSGAIEVLDGSLAPVLEWLCPSDGGSGFVRPKPGLCVAESIEFPAYEHAERCRLAPARPAGRSWCGAHDMAGNVWETLANGRTIGGSYLTPALGRHEDDLAKALTYAFEPSTHLRDDVGFRVALEAAR